MNASRILSGAIALAMAALLFACTDNTQKKSTKPDDETAAEEGALPISEDALRTLLADGSKLYWSLPGAATTETETIDGDEMARIDPKRFPTIEALRKHLRPIFTDNAISLIFEDFGVTEHDGKLWILQGDGDDARNYNEAEIIESTSSNDTVNVTLDVPLGDGGQTDTPEATLVRAGKGWKIDSDPYGADETE